MKIEAPHIAFRDIKQKADEIRSQFQDQTIPFDIHAAIEFDLDFEIRPVKELRDKANSDALLLCGQKTILIDEEYFLDERQQNRIRFSLAHELGHFFLHPMLKPELSNIEDWIHFQKNIDDESFGWFESQANEFAGRLLVVRCRAIVI